MWLRKAIEDTKAAAEMRAATFGAVWNVRRNDDDGFDYTVYGTDPDEAVADTWRVDAATCIADSDPRSIIARCEAELAILDEHASDGDGQWPQCVRCADTHPDRCECGVLDGQHWRTAQDYPCRTVRLVASGYRHWEGFDLSWLPA